ncbi:MAG TPA: ABC transporter ATP-binding protein [Phycisphaerales bacterium]|nr:ABC transporter ATP-binding protein [Phycisphaerales bacterium]
MPPVPSYPPPAVSGSIHPATGFHARVSCYSSPLMDSPPILIRNLFKRYRDLTAINDLTFHVNAGQVLGLVGPNGAGKTTTMRCACGIIPATSGSIAITGHDLALDPIAAKRDSAFVPDDPHLFETLTVWEHLRFTAAAYRVPDWQPRADSLLTQFELTEKKNTIAQELSRGMRQKVAICCAYLHQPRAIWLDEPLTGLDPRGIRTMKDSIRRIAADGSAVIISSHLLSLVEDICTDLLILHRGQLMFFGSMTQASADRKANGDATLEDFFFRLTEGAASAHITPPPQVQPPIPLS